MWDTRGPTSLADLLSINRLTNGEVSPITNNLHLMIDWRADLHPGFADICQKEHRIYLRLFVLRRSPSLTVQAKWRIPNPTVGVFCYEHSAHIRHIPGSRDQNVYAHAAADFIFTHRQQDYKLQFWVNYSGDVDFFQQEDVLLEDVESVLESGDACWTTEEAKITQGHLQEKRFHILGQYLKYQYLITETK